MFISHASPDKVTFARPLAEALRKLGVAVWYDEFSLELGDSISQQIDRGIANSRFGIVVVSPAFISRNWTQHELRLEAAHCSRRLLLSSGDVAHLDYLLEFRVINFGQPLCRVFGQSVCRVQSGRK